MRRSLFLTALALFAAGAAFVLIPRGETGVDLPNAAELPPPPPTEHWLAADVEKKNNKARKEWIAGFHKTAPGVDYKAIEAENGLAQMEKRRLLARGPRGPEDGHWVERGSENQAGRMHVATHALDGSGLYAGSALGGVWKGSLDGEDWTPIGDGLYGGAHWLAVLDPRSADSPHRVFAVNGSAWLHYSDDDGDTWTASDGLDGYWTIKRVVVADDETIFVLAGYDWPTSYTLFRSIDGGESFEDIRDLGDYAGDVWVPRAEGAYEGAWLVDDDSLWQSLDGGDSWDEVAALGLGGSRAELAISEAGRMWLAHGGERLYSSDDDGQSWTQVNSLNDYWGELQASITDVDVAAYGGVEFYSTRNGSNFSRMNSWGDYYSQPLTRLHADIMGIDVVLQEDGSELWYVSTDGGLYRSTDQLETVRNLSMSGLRVSQYYTTHTSNVTGNIAAGAQDQGYQWTEEDNEGPLEFEQLISGDYAHLTSGDGSHQYVYSVYPGIVLVQYRENDPELSYASFPNDSASWLPPIVADPNDNTAFFFCGSRLWRYEKGGNGWSSSRYSDKDFDNQGGYEYLSAIAFSPLNSDKAWAATNYGRVFWSEDAGVNWTRSDTLNYSQYWYGHAVLPSRLDEDVVYVGGSGYNAHEVYRSTDGGRSWEAWDEGLPYTQVYDLVEAPDYSGRVFAGTETAAYMREADGDEWIDITSDTAPITIYWDAQAVEEGGLIRFGTYGRGIWDFVLDDIVEQPQDSEDTSTPGDTDEPAKPTPGLQPICGCSGGLPAGSLALLMAVVVTRRRRRGAPGVQWKPSL